MIFPARVFPDGAQYSFGAQAEQTFLERPDGARLAVVRFPVENARGTFIYFKGNAGTLNNVEFITRMALENGFEAVAVDYRGYGLSRGARSEQAMLEDALAVFDWAVEGSESKPVVILGYSLGTTFSLHVASQREADAVILLAPFSSLRSVGEHHYPFLPTALARFTFRSDRFAKDVSEPITIYHGTTDTIVPFSEGQKLMRGLKETDQFVAVEGEGHGGVAGSGIFRQGVSDLLASY